MLDKRGLSPPHSSSSPSASSSSPSLTSSSSSSSRSSRSSSSSSSPFSPASASALALSSSSWASHLLLSLLGNRPQSLTSSLGLGGVVGDHHVVEDGPDLTWKMNFVKLQVVVA